MLSALNIITMTLGICFTGWLWFFIIASSVTLGAFLWFTRYDKWWLGFIPVISVFAKRDCSGMNLVLCIAYAVFWMAALFTYAFIPVIICAVLTVVVNYQFAKVYLVKVHPAVYAFVPLGKVFTLYKEVFA